jgi:hypothetical protein
MGLGEMNESKTLAVETGSAGKPNREASHHSMEDPELVKVRGKTTTGFHA